MKKTKLKLGFAPTRRGVFDEEIAAEQKNLIRRAIQDFDAEVVDIEDVTPEGMIIYQDDVDGVVRKFKEADVDALFIPHCNFGSEGPSAQVASKLNVPTLLWGTRDEAPDSEGGRFRDTQCGLFATGKALRRHNVPFSYITNSRVDDKVFLKGFERFLRVAAVVKAARNVRVLQIGPRPEEFLSVICNESELMERFGVQVFPVSLGKLILKINEIMESGGDSFVGLCDELKNGFKDFGDNPEKNIQIFAAMKLAIEYFADVYKCNCAAIQCWDSLQDYLPVHPCFVNSLLADNGFPCACETDINGAITALMIQAATGNKLPHFFADITVRHPEDDNIELLWHCGPFPPSFAKDRSACAVCNSWAGQPYCGGNYFQMKNGPITVCRFDGDHGNYSLFIGEGEGVDGPYTKGTYVWFKVDDWAKWEHKLVQGPYIHHVAGTYGNVGEILQEACRYIPGLAPDPVSPSKEELEKRWIG